MKKVAVILSTVIVVSCTFIGVYYYEKKHSSKNILSSQNASVSTFKLALPIADVVTHFVIQYGIDHGFYTKQGINVQIEDVSQGGPFSMVAANQADATIGGMSRPMAVYFNDVNSRVVANGYETFDNFIVSRFDKDHVGQIRSVAVNSAGGEEQNMVDAVLKNLGLDPKNVQHVSAPTSSARIAMLEKGDVDLVMLTSENDYASISGMQKYFLLDSNLVSQSAIFIRSLVSTQDVINNNPVKMQKFVLAFHNSLIDMQNNESEMITYEQKKLSLNPDQANKFYNQFIQAVQNVSFVPVVNNQLKSIAELNKNGATDPQRDLSQFVYADFAKKAIETK